jgi:hypothetical protein
MKTFFFNIWRIGRWILLVILILFVGLVIYRIPFVAEQEETQEAIEYIKAQKLVMEDVSGERLPPHPDQKLVDATVEGVDVNKNNIRDDVELAIFEMYPGNENIKIRSAMLQYAMALQLYITEVFNSETWKVAVQKSGRGSGCLFATSPKVTLDDNDEVIQEAFNVGTSRLQEVENLILNTKQRQDVYFTIDNYATSFGSSIGEDCDLVFN